MNFLLWALQITAALIYGASGVMKVFLFEQVSKDVRSFGALPRNVWKALGGLELVCALALVIPAAIHALPNATPVASAILAIESLVFIHVHVRYREITAICMSLVLGLVMGFLAYGRFFLRPMD